ncbi:MAG: DNA cytosine methyltransferase [Candidatus Thiodiazotropha sp. (ex Lucinoma aequizonata)]|nr:DNA cytosine methyltransferase [Candidatus Thiodiazotropha sp. (ex Lucinoma aequizonata)]MCU7887680.1 DNA cytosine methyltransferase [Candidatus Thiodiazotropha sp. (ex Lucinoma aequizonata)]MCU7897004.1 DNA cytosine methyltransferase [Candidatus Thiodiazotropha sp. (ex Lucinoma aequizonata)]MCU7900178.1 DNA cytosine methyltransferase [Candidatus Thiodiazotropha sp. (ex Lucinoma aequizonata)]MCU7901423.1 DNA cytosine methyltransferase [Candidatus Thiodiazotropha sp. (ex Lucinoma aequizonata)
MIQQSQPALLILENVKHYQNTVSMQVIRDVLSFLGYTLHETTLKGGDFGAIDGRERFYMMAASDDLPIGTLPFDTLTPPRDHGRYPGAHCR